MGRLYSKSIQDIRVGMPLHPGSKWTLVKAVYEGGRLVLQEWDQLGLIEKEYASPSTATSGIQPYGKPHDTAPRARRRKVKLRASTKEK